MELLRCRILLFVTMLEWDQEEDGFLDLAPDFACE